MMLHATTHAATRTQFDMHALTTTGTLQRMMQLITFQQ
jgi:hypothetical protein